MLKTKDEIKIWLDEASIQHYTINDDLTVDVVGNVVSIPNLKHHFPVQFGKVTGDFNCYNAALVSLKGCPKYVGGAFNCSYNELTSFEHAPEIIGNDFLAWINPILSFNTFNTKFGGTFSFQHPQQIKLADFSNYFKKTGELNLESTQMEAILLNKYLENCLPEQTSSRKIKI